MRTGKAVQEENIHAPFSGLHACLKGLSEQTYPTSQLPRRDSGTPRRGKNPDPAARLLVGSPVLGAQETDQKGAKSRKRPPRIFGVQVQQTGFGTQPVSRVALFTAVIELLDLCIVMAWRSVTLCLPVVVGAQLAGRYGSQDLLRGAPHSQRKASK